jgi:hypothetical protein
MAPTNPHATKRRLGALKMIEKSTVDIKLIVK